MKSALLWGLFATGVALGAPAQAQLTFYEHDNFGGRSFVTERQIGNFERFGFNDRASSARVRGGRWEVCTDARFSGRCVVLRRGDYPSLRDLGLNDRVSSVRPVSRANRNDDHRDGVYERRLEAERPRRPEGRRY